MNLCTYRCQLKNGKWYCGKTHKFCPTGGRSKLKSKLCKCGCSKYASLGKKFILGHHPFYNKKHAKQTKKKMSEARKGKYYGELSPTWKGGISAYPYGPGFNKELKEYIREKFNHTCVLCGKFAATPHNIDYNKDNNKEDNFVLLCRGCNCKVNFNRDQWEIGFKIFIGGSQKNN